MKNLEITFGSGFLEECPEILNMNISEGNDFDLTLKHDLKTHGYELDRVRYAKYGDGCFLLLDEDLPDRKEEKKIIISLLI